MAKADKKVSIAAFDKVMKEQFENETTIQWHGVDVRVKRNLSLADMLEFVDDVVKSCFHEEYGFMPEVMDLAIRSNVLTRYANFSLPDSLEHRYRMVYETDAVSTILSAINAEQYEEIIDAIDSKVCFLCEGKLSDIEARVNDVVTAMEEMRDNTKEIFGEITQSDLKNMMSAVSNGGLDEQKLVSAYLEQTRSADNKDALVEQVDRA